MLSYNIFIYMIIYNNIKTKYKNKINMEEYINITPVNAKPMTRKEYNDFRGGQRPTNGSGEDKGYFIEHITVPIANTKQYDCYISWLPKDEFESLYKKINTYKESLVIEKEQLLDRYTKLHAFLTENSMTVSNDNFLNLKLQDSIMKVYLKVLDGRIDNKPLKDLKFGEAITILDLGYAVARKGWNGKNMFIFKQVPCTLNEDIISKMKYLPNNVKNIFAKRKDDITYINQVCIVDKDNNICNWNPSTADCFATDWYVVKLDDK